MFIQRMLNQTGAPALERLLSFTEARQGLIADDIANVDSQNYRQKDLSVERFQQMLRQRVDAAHNPAHNPSTGSSPAGADDFSDIDAELEYPTRGILFHDGNNRSMEQLMSDQAKNALMHQVAVELLRKQYQSMQAALQDKVG